MNGVDGNTNNLVILILINDFTLLINMEVQ